MPIISNQSRTGNFVIRATSNETYIVVGNTSVSNVVSNDDINQFVPPGGGQQPLANTANVFITGCYIRQLLWTTNGQITISNSTNVMYDLFATGEMNLDTYGMAANDVIAANLSIGFTGNGTVLIKAKKIGNFTSEY